MKITFEFDTNSEQFDRIELNRIQKAFDMALALYDIDNLCRKYRKYDERESIPVEEIDNEIGKIYSKYNINIDDILE